MSPNLLALIIWILAPFILLQLLILFQYVLWLKFSTLTYERYAQSNILIPFLPFSLVSILAGSIPLLNYVVVLFFSIFMFMDIITNDKSIASYFFSSISNNLKKYYPSYFFRYKLANYILSKEEKKLNKPVQDKIMLAQEPLDVKQIEKLAKIIEAKRAAIK